MDAVRERIKEIRKKLNQLIINISMTSVSGIQDKELYNKLLKISAENKEFQPLIEYIILMMDKHNTVYEETLNTNKEYLLELIATKENIIEVLDKLVHKLEKDNVLYTMKNNKIIIFIIVALFMFVFYLIDRDLAIKIFAQIIGILKIII